MDAKHDVGQTQNDKFIIGGIIPLILSSTYMWQPFLCMPLSPRSSPSLIHSKRPWTASFSCPCAVLHLRKNSISKFHGQKEITLPLFRLIESKMKRRRLLVTPEAKERALTVLILTVSSLFFVYVTIELPQNFWNMKLCFTTYWINLHILFIVREMYRSTTDVKWKRRTASAAIGVCLAIVLVQYCYCFVMMFILFDWAFPCLGFILAISYMCYAAKQYDPHDDKISSSCALGLREIGSDRISFWDELRKPLSPYEIDFVMAYQMPC